MRTEGHDMGKDLGTPPAAQAPKMDAEHPGYETTDVNVNGVAVFLAGLFGTVIIFFFFCYGMGKVINNLWEKEDGTATKWTTAAGMTPLGKGDNLKSNAAMQQQELGQMTSNFPSPRLDIDDGNQATADLHAREDLLLEHTSRVDGQPGTIRIPIERAMELIAQRGLPVANAAATPTPSLAEANKPEVKAPLTTGFARTGYELTTIEAREQKMTFAKAEAAK
ncbi:MAG TPA: hypothetical protein VF865_06930 [Acidobacteriaceae bacterium]